MISVTVLKWTTHNPRKEFKAPRWFALSNRILEDPDFFDFTAEELKAWIYILCQCSQKNSDKIVINLSHADRVCGISEKRLISALEKLQAIKIVEYDRTRTRHVRNTNAILHYNTEQTEQNNTVQPPAVFDFNSIYELYPVRVKGPSAEKQFAEQILNQQDYDDLKKALQNYIKYLQIEDWRRPKQTFAAFLGSKRTGFFWREWIEFDADSLKPKVDSKNQVQEFWTTESHNIFKSIKDHGTKARQVLGEERWSWIQSVGGYDFVNRIKYDEFGVRKLADMLKTSNQQESA